MYKGEAMEYGATSAVLNNPVHPYTKALLACRPSPEHKGKQLPTVADFLEADKGRSDVVITDMPQQMIIPAADVLLSVNNLRVWFTEHKDWLGKPTSWYKAVDGVSFDLHKGEVLGLVGESGCGKSTISRSLMGLLPVNEGQLIFDGKDLSKISQTQWKQVRKDIQLIFQDPFASLNPRMTVGSILTEPLVVHNIVPQSELKKEAQRLLDLVHLPSDAYKRYPHQFSGGQRQRIGIARALALRPELIICDESVSALDVSIQAQVLNLLKELQSEFDLSYLFISHDLSVVHYISDRVMVMQAGKIVESGDATQVLKSPAHPYTQRLIAAMP
jgi:peptide/nickel transport system ATP-binding protein